MASWGEFEADQPALAALVRGRFEVPVGSAMLASIRSDGSPRISAVEPPFIVLGEMWVGMMAGSTKAVDLLRDSRLALHAPSLDRDVRDGDAKLTGTAVDRSDQIERLRAEVEARGGRLPPGEFPLVTVDIASVSFLRPERDHLRIEVWRPDSGYRVVARH